MSVSLVPARRTGRVTRNPRHNFQLRHKPFVIQPFMLAPVWPAETLKSALLQARAVSKPMANPLIGGWLEYYFFYVKHRDLDGRDDFSGMMLDLDKDMTSYNSAANVAYYHGAASINWTQLCLKRIVEDWFRDADETWNSNVIDGMPVARVNTDNVSNSAILDDNFQGPQDELITVGVDDQIGMSEIDAAMRTWQFQRANNMTEMDYEDWLATYGIQTKPEENHRPELIRYVREWQYPSNTVEPTTGAPSSAISYSIAERADKNRFFKEPGFIVGVTVFRPKVYFRNQVGNAADWMKNALDWLPAILRDDPWTSVRKFAETDGPFQIVSDANGYWLDLKDLAIHGDQFINFATAGVTNANLVDLPTAALNTRYVSSADVDGFFPGTDKTMQQDGVVQLSILGALQDTTPNMTRLR